MHLYSVTLQRAGAITQAIVGNFLGVSPKEPPQILVSRGKVLELYKFEDSQLVSVYAQDVFGVIRSIQPHHVTGGTKDYVIVGSDSGRIVVLEWDDGKKKFEKVHMETYGKTGCRRIVPGQHVAVDPKGRAVMIGAVEKQKFVYMLQRDNQGRLTISSPLEAHKSHTVLYHMVALDVAYENPVFACIELDHGESDTQSVSIENASIEKTLVYYELDLGLNHVVKKWATQIDRTAHHLVALAGTPEGPGGVLVFSENFVTYAHVGKTQTRAPIPRRRDMPMERGLLTVSSAIHKSKRGSFVLAQSEVGDLYKITLETSGEKVTQINVQYFDTVPVSNSICIMRNGYLFVASEFGDHKFYHIQSLDVIEDESEKFEMYFPGEGKNQIAIPVLNPHPLKQMLLSQTLDSFSPIVDMKVCDVFNEGSNQMISLCGRGPRSTLRILRHGLPVTELAVSPLTGTPLSIFTLKLAATDQYDKYIVISFINYTMVLVVGETVEQVYDSGLRENVNTLAASLFGDDTLLQVHSGGIQLVRSDKRGYEWDAGKRTVIKAATNEYQVLLALSGGEVIYFEMDNSGRLSETEKIETGLDIACVAIGPIPPGKKRARFVAVGYFDKTVRIYSLDPEACLNVLSRQAVPSEPESIVITLMPSLFESTLMSNYLTVGLNNGIMLRSVMDSVTGELSDTRTRFLGIKPVKLQQLKLQNGQSAVLAMSTRSWLTYYYQGRFHTTPLSYVALDSCSTFNSEQCPDGLVALGDTALRVLSLDKLVGQTLNPSSVPLKYTPRRFAVSDRFKKLIIIETDHNVVSSSEKVKENDGDMDVSDDNENEAAPQYTEADEFGTQQKTVPNSGKWASQIRVFDPVTSESTEIIELQDNEAAFSITLCTFLNNPNAAPLTNQKRTQLQSDQYVIVGTVQNLKLLPARSCTGGLLHCYKLLEGGKLQLIHKTPIEDIPTAMEEFKGRLLVGVKNNLRIYDLGKKKLLRKCENHQFPNSIQTLAVEGNRIYVGDITESFHFVKYNRSENTLTIFADDTSPRWITASVQLDYDTMAGADKFGNIFVLRLPKDVSEEMEDISGSTTAANRWVWERGLLNGAPQKANLLAQFHVGEIVTSMVKTSLVSGTPQVIVFGTVMGSIGLLIPFSISQDVEFFNLLEMHMREECPPLCGRDHLAYRSFYFPVKAVVDGDLCEQYLGLDTTKQRAVSDELRRSVAEVAKKIEDMRSQTGF